MMRLFLDDLLRVRPCARRMRVIGTEHHFIGVEDGADHSHAQRVIDEANPNLALEVFARQQLRKRDRAIAGEPSAISAALIPDIETLDHARYPSKSCLGHDDLYARMTIKNAHENKPGDRFEELNALRVFCEARGDRDRRIDAAGIVGIETCLFDQDSEMK